MEKPYFELPDHLIEALEALDVRHCNIYADSRKIKPGDVFLAYSGTELDGRSYIPQAIAQGAACVLWDKSGEFVWQDQWQVKNLGVSQLQKYASAIAQWFYGFAPRSLHVVGVTGTNGKTSISQWLAQAFDLLAMPCAIIGTIGNGFWGELEETSHTTPDAVTVQDLLQNYQHNNAQAIAMEVSSHGLTQYRVDGVPFEGAVFTNLTRDHLDYHGSFEAYGEAKTRLFYFPTLRYATINYDDAFGVALYARLKQERPELKIYSYGFAKEADICIDEFTPSLRGSVVCLKTPWGSARVETTLLGRFNAQNLAATVAVLCAHGFAFEDVIAVLPKIKPATGRMDCIIEANKPLVVVDYAHTPDALEKALKTLQETKAQNSQLWCVFGCGGNRDKGKRPLMGQMVANFADKVVVTSDNPRLEDPQAIIEDILPGVPHPALVEIDRQKAIEQAIDAANSHDIVLVAGKGHETYQDVGGKKHHFSDFEIARAALARKK